MDGCTTLLQYGVGCMAPAQLCVGTLLAAFVAGFSALTTSVWFLGGVHALLAAALLSSKM